MCALGLAAAMAAGVGAEVSLGASFPVLSLNDLRDNSDLVAWVQIEHKDARWLENGHKIASFYEARTLRVVEGSLDSQERDGLIIGIPGGVVDGVGQWVPGAPIFSLHEIYLVFLGKRDGPNGARGVVALSQGVFRRDGQRFAPLVPVESLELAGLYQWAGRQP